MLFKIVEDFVESAFHPNGFGFFEGNLMAVHIARGLSRQQIKKYRRYGIIPTAFFIWLKEVRLVNPGMPIPRGGLKREELDQFWSRHFIGKEQLRSKRETKERNRIQNICAPELNKAFALQDHVWALSNFNNKRRPTHMRQEGGV